MADAKRLFDGLFISEEERMTQRLVRDFVDKEIMPVRDQLDDDSDGKLTNKILQGLVDIGLLGMGFPKEYGGGGRHSAVTNYIVAEELSRGDLGIAGIIGCTAWAWRPALVANNKAVIDQFMPEFCQQDVKLACYNMTEPGGGHGGGGCDIENPHYEGRKLRTMARLEHDEWVINGTKMWAINSGIARLNCVLCTIDPNLGSEGIVLIYVPEPWPGVSHSPFENKTGVRTQRNCATYFDDVRVPKEWGIGPGGEAAGIFRTQLTGALLCAQATGVMQGAFETVLEYTGNRIVGDKPIRQHSMAGLILGQMATTLETSRIVYLTAAHMSDHPEIYGPLDEGFMPARMSIARLFGIEAAVRVINDAMNLMGAYGYVRENHIEKYWRDAKMLQLVTGGVHLNSFNVCRGYYDLNL